MSLRIITRLLAAAIAAAATGLLAGHASVQAATTPRPVPTVQTPACFPHKPCPHPCPPPVSLPGQVWSCPMKRG